MDRTLDRLTRAIQAYQGPPVRLMEVCGTHTRQISAFGIPALLPPNLSLISGPGCPVCVTPARYIDQAAALSLRPNATLLSFGDLWRVPGRGTSLMKARAQGGCVELMYSPMDALQKAAQAPERVFYVAAVGFETTLPAYALLLQKAHESGIRNLRLFPALKALVPALRWICEHNPDIHGFLGPGHVRAILGYGGYQPLCAQYRIPMAVAGFGYEHLIAAIFDLIRQIQRGSCEARNLYPGAVSREGNQAALALINRFFVRKTSFWRGLGAIDDSGYYLAPEYAAFDAGLDDSMGQPSDADEPDGCLCGSVIMGRARPVDCGHFGHSCTPETPLGPCMVSSEGACGIWYANGYSHVHLDKRFTDT